MMHQPWDRAQPDEWLPRSLRLCWGGGGDGGGGGGWGDSGGGFGGPSTGGGDWGSSGSYDASGMNATGDLSAWAGTAYDASTFGTGMGGGGDWGSFGDTSYAGMNAPNPTFADVAGPNPGVTTGGGDWGSAGAFSAAGTGGGPGGAMFGAAQGAAQGAGGGFWGGDQGGGGLFGDYGGGGGYTGGGGGPQGGGASIGPFGAANFGGEGGGQSYAGSPTASPGWAPAGSTGSYGAGIGKGGASDESGVGAPSGSSGTYGAGVGKGGASDETGAEPDAGDTPAPSEAEPGAEPLGTPTPSESETAPEAAPSDAAPSGKGIGSDIVASPETQAAPAQTEPSAPTTSAFGPQTLNTDYQGSPYASDYDQGAQQAAPQQDSFDSRFGFDTAAPQDSFDSRFGDWGQQPADPSQAYQDALQSLSGVTQTALDPASQAYQGIEPGAEQFAFEPAGPTPTAEPSWFQNLISDIPGLRDIQDVRGFEVLADPATWLSTKNQETWSNIANLPNTLNPNNWVDINSPMGSPVGPMTTAFDLQALGEQGKAGQLQDTFDSRFAMDPNIDTTNWGAVFEGAAGPEDVSGGIDPSAEQYGVETGINPGAEQYGIEAAAPTIEAFIQGGRETDFANAAPGAIEASIPGGRETDFAGSPAETAAQSAAAAAQQAGVSPEAAGAAAAAAYAAAARGASPAEQAEAAAAAAQQAGASQQQAMAIANGVYGQVQEGGGRPQSQGTTLGQVQDAVYGTGGPYITPGGNVYGGHTIADIQAAVYGDSLPGMPTGNPSAPLSEDTSQQSYADTTGRAQSFIPGGQVTNFEYAGSPAQQPQQAPPPSLVDMAQPGINPGAEQYGTQPPAPPLGSPPPADIPPGTSGGGTKGVYDAPPWQGPTTSDRYLSEVYDRVPNKIDNTGNFTFKDPASAARLGMEKTQYAIGGLDKDVKTVVEAMGKAMDRAGVPWSITAAYRDNYRQGLITEGFKASPTGSWHGGTARVPTEPGLRGGIKGEPLREGEKNQATKEQIAKGGETYGLGRALDVIGARGNSQAVWSWIDQNGAKFGMDRTYANQGNKDPAHIQPMANFRELAAKIRAGFDPLTGKYQTENGKPDPNFARKQEAQDRAQREAGRDPNAPRPPADIPPRALEPPDVPRPPADIPPPAQPPAARPPAEAPLPDEEARPPTDIPAPTLMPPRAGRLDIGVVNNALQRATAHLNKNSGEAEFAAASVVAAKDLARAGVPLAVARSEMQKGAYAGAAKNGYDINHWAMGGVYKSKIDGGIEAALQGYHPAKPGEVQGPPSPAQQRSEAPGLLHFVAGGRDVGAPPAIQGFPGRDYREGEIIGNPNLMIEDYGFGTPPPAPPRGLQDPNPDTPFAPAPPFSPDLPGEKAGERSASLLDFLQNFNPISTAEAKGRGRDVALEQALAQAREGGNFGGQRGMSVVGNKVFTFYAPGASGLKGMEGPMIGSKGNPLTTLDDVRNGAGFVSLAGHPAQFGQQVFIGNITYTSPVDGKQYTLNNVVGRVDDTGGKFTGKDNPDQSHFDIAVGDFSRGWNDRTAGSFVASNYATAVPGRGIGSDYAADEDQGPAVAAQPPQEAAPRGLAEGGHVAKGERVVVGEEGPEYFVPDQPGTVWPHIPQPGKPGNIDRWPKVPAPEFPGRFGGVEREIRRQTRAAQDPSPGLMDMIDSGQLRLNEANWRRMIGDPDLIALGRSRIEDRR